MIEYQVILNVYSEGRSGKHALRSSDRDTAISRFVHLDALVKDKRRKWELVEWAKDNLAFDAEITSVDGVYGVAYVKILGDSIGG